MIGEKYYLPKIHDHQMISIWVIWDSLVMVMVAMNSRATSDPLPGEGRLKSPGTISLENSITNLATH